MDKTTVEIQIKVRMKVGIDSNNENEKIAKISVEIRRCIHQQINPDNDNYPATK